MAPARAEAVRLSIVSYFKKCHLKTDGKTMWREFLTEESQGFQPRRSFLKMAALSGATALAASADPALALGEGEAAGAAYHGTGTMPFLGTRGGAIVDAQGHKVRLRGTCAGGWMNMEDFINGHTGAEHMLRAQMADTLGAAKATFFFDRLLTHFFNEDDVIFLRQIGANVVRLPLNYRHFEDDEAPYKYKEAGFARLDQVLRWCEKHGLYVILDMHSAQGWQNVHWHSDNASRISLLWHDVASQDRFVALWKEFARRYRDASVVAGYDILNEPCSNNARGDFAWNIQANYRPNWNAINALYRRTVTEIRKIDARHIIFLEGDNYSKLFSGFEAPFAEHLVYTTHNYSPAGFGPGAYPGNVRNRSAGGAAEFYDAARQEKEFLDQEGTIFARRHNVPLWVGEFGSVYNGPHEEIPDRLRSMNDQIGTFDRNGAQWTTWTYKDVGVMGITTLDPASPYLQHIAEFQKKKLQLGTDDWMSWLPTTAVKDATAQLANQIYDVVGDTRFPPQLNAKCMAQSTLAFYTSLLMQPSYAGLFNGMSETDIDHMLSSFSVKQCIPNKGLIDILSHYMALPA
jgi:aryl-phospho-beta-D-glucosidase BglC (GH1 family)